MKKILIPLLATALASSLLLAGCGQSTTTESSTAPPASTTESSSTAGSSEAETGTLTIESYVDGELVSMEYPEKPTRSVSMAGFSTETLLALGVGDTIVGYAFQDNEVLPQYREQFDTLNPLSDDPYTKPAEEITLSADPDFYIGWTDDLYTYDWCQKNGIMTYGLYCEKVGATVEDVYTDILNLGKIFRVEDRANEIVNEMKENIATAQELVQGKEPVSVFVCDVASDEKYAFTAGGGLVADIIKLSGGENIIKDTDKNWVRDASWEVIAQANPDWIIIDTYQGQEDFQGTIDMLKSLPATKDLDAVKNDKFIILGLTDLSAGERLDETVELLATTFHNIDQ